MHFPRTILRVSTLILIFLAFARISHAQESNQSQPWIRVLIASGSRSATVAASGPSRVNLMGSPESVGSFDEGHTYTFELTGGGVQMGGTDRVSEGGFTIVSGDDSGRITVNRKTYRGIVRIVCGEGSLSVVNVLPMEQYLWGVIPCEVPCSWPVEVLRAQAVAARTYAMRALEQYPDRPFDVYSTVADQVYSGAGSEEDRTTQACMDTYGQVCTWNGTPIIAYYHAAAGGWTATGEDVFGNSQPYLRSVPSRDSAVYRWTYSATAGQLARALRGIGYQVGSIDRVWVHRFSSEGRAEEIKIVHSGGIAFVSGVELRRALGASNIQSTYFTIQGQAAPDIPGGESPQTALNPLEQYSFTNPQILVPLPVSMMLEEESILSADGSRFMDRAVVRGANGSRQYIGGWFWVAFPVRVGDLDEARIARIVSASERLSADLRGSEAVEDPGRGVGTPQNGSFVFVGHGCGHGVGMSQHGARILAETGWTYQQILKYFYTGIEIERLW